MSPGATPSSADELLAQADQVERMARLVSYGPDKRALMEQAERLRERARVLQSEPRTWSEGKPPKPESR